MSTFAWSYKSNVSGQKPPKENVGKIEDWQRKRSADSSLAGKSVTGPSTKKPRVNIAAKLYVGNLHWETTEAELAHYFSVFGDLEDVRIIKDHSTGHSRGFAFIVFSKVSDAQEAKRWCSFNYPMLRGRDIKVTSAERRLPRHRTAASVHHDTTWSSFPSAPKDINSTLFWEYKWSKDDNAETYGPYETSVMLQWVKQGYFEDGCWVRQVDVTRLRGDVPSLETRSEAQETSLPRDIQEEGLSSNKALSLISYSDSSDSEDDGTTVDKVDESNEGEKSKEGSEIDQDSSNQEISINDRDMQRQDEVNDQDTVEKREEVLPSSNALDRDNEEGDQGQWTQSGSCQSDGNESVQVHGTPVDHQDNHKVDFSADEKRQDQSAGTDSSDARGDNLDKTENEGQENTFESKQDSYDDDEEEDGDNECEDEESSRLSHFIHISEINFAMFP